MIGSPLPSLSYLRARHSNTLPNSISIVVRDRNSDKSTQKHVGGRKFCCDCASLIFEASLAKKHEEIFLELNTKPHQEHLGIYSCCLYFWISVLGRFGRDAKWKVGLVMRGPLELRLALLFYSSTKTFSGSRCATRF
jgi:hypothetical protein